MLYMVYLIVKSWVYVNCVSLSMWNFGIVLFNMCGVFEGVLIEMWCNNV